MHMACNFTAAGGMRDIYHRLICLTWHGLGFFSLKQLILSLHVLVELSEKGPEQNFP